jgi:hypothetical protein
MAVIPMGGPREFNTDDLMGQAREYVTIKKEIESLEGRQKELRNALFEKIDSDGYEDDKGNFWLELPEEIEGYLSLQKQKRVTRKIDEQVADTVIEEKGLEERLYKVVRVVDEDALMAALYDGTLTEEEVDSMYPSKVVWALMTSKK